MDAQTEARFQAAKEKVIGIERERRGIGTLSEKTIHAVLKHFYAPDEAMHEIPIGNYVADIYTGQEIIEIQTRSFNAMRPKLSFFLQEYPVTVVYPIPYRKWISWIDEETGECSPKRKSPLTGSPYMAFPELYKLKMFLKNANLHFRFVLLDMDEYRLLNGWSSDRKKGSCRFDRIPTALAEEIIIERREDYMQFVPLQLERFTSAQFAKAAHIRRPLAQTTLNILYELDIVTRIGKQGKSYLYEPSEI